MLYGIAQMLVLYNREEWNGQGR